MQHLEQLFLLLPDLPHIYSEWKQLVVSYNTSQWLKTSSERVADAEARAQQEANARQTAEARAENAEAELAKALAEIERLQAR